MVVKWPGPEWTAVLVHRIPRYLMPFRVRVFGFYECEKNVAPTPGLPSEADNLRLVI